MSQLDGENSHEIHELLTRLPHAAGVTEEDAKNNWHVDKQMACSTRVGARSRSFGEVT